MVLTTLTLTRPLGIGTIKIFRIQYNIDISLSIQYLNNISNDTACLQGHNFVKLSTVSFGNFANELLSEALWPNVII